MPTGGVLRVKRGADGREVELCKGAPSARVVQRRQGGRPPGVFRASKEGMTKPMHAHTAVKEKVHIHTHNRFRGDK